MSTDRAEVCASAEPQDMGKQDAQREETHEPGSPGKDTPPPTSSAVPSSPKLSKGFCTNFQCLNNLTMHKMNLF